MEMEGGSEQDTQVCAFMGIGSQEQEMVQLSLENKVSEDCQDGKKQLVNI